MVVFLLETKNNSFFHAEQRMKERVIDISNSEEKTKKIIDNYNFFKKFSISEEYLEIAPKSAKIGVYLGRIMPKVKEYVYLKGVKELKITDTRQQGFVGNEVWLIVNDRKYFVTILIASGLIYNTPQKMKDHLKVDYLIYNPNTPTKII